MWLALLLLFQNPASEAAAFIQRGDLDRAQQTLEQALRKNPADASLLNLQGILYAQRSRYPDAEASFRKALTTAPRSVSILENLGRLYLQNQSADPKAADKAIDIYRKLLAIEAANREGLYQLAVLLLHRGGYAESLALLDRLPEPARRTSQAVAARLAVEAALKLPAAPDTARQLAAHERLASADAMGILPVLEKYQATPLLRPTLEALVNRQGASPELLVALARCAYAEKNYQEALGYLAHARDLAPRNASIRFFFGMTAVAMDLVLEAKNALTEAVNLEPGNASYNYALGAVLAQEREASNAIPYFEKYCELRPGDPRGRFAIAVARYLAKDLSPAALLLRQLVSDPQTAAGSYYFLGRIAKEENRLPEAERDLTAAIRLLPKFAGARAELGHVYLRQNRLPEAETQLRMAITLQPDHFLANLTLLSLLQRTADPRAEAQKTIVARLQGQRQEKERDLWRTVEVRPF